MHGTGDMLVRLGVAAGVFALMAGWEWLVPVRARLFDRRVRWPSNLLLVAVGVIVVRIVAPVSLAGIAVMGQGFGVIPRLGLPAWLAGVLGVVVFDLAIYGQHVAMHRVPWLWRLHRVHHTDCDLDVTTGLRFHPLEILISHAYKMAIVFVAGISAEAVVLFEILLNGCAMFNHANVALPSGLERVLRALVVTPALHAIHHSVEPVETDSNYGFNLVLWDRLFGTYRARPALPITIGLRAFRAADEARLDRLLTQPFRTPGE